MKRMSDEELLQNTKGIIDELLKNASHSFGIDFQRLNLTAIEVDIRLYEKNIFDPITINPCSTCHMTRNPDDPNVALIYGCEDQWYVKCYSCLKVTGLHSTKRNAIIAWNKK